MTYAIETRAGTSIIKRLLRTREMSTLRYSTGNILRDGILDRDTRNICEMQDIIRWTRIRRRAWRDHGETINRMDDNQLAKIAENQTKQDGLENVGAKVEHHWRTGTLDKRMQDVAL